MIYCVDEYHVPFIQNNWQRETDRSTVKKLPAQNLEGTQLAKKF